jgi:hypothetical protein
MGFYHLLLLPILQDSPTLIFRIISFKVISYHFLLLPMLQDSTTLIFRTTKIWKLKPSLPHGFQPFSYVSEFGELQPQQEEWSRLPKLHLLPSRLVPLDLSHNLIVGSIPCQLLFNTSIEVLSLASNKIDGSLSFGCFANQTSSLRALDISDNNVTGSLPENIGHLLPYLSHVNMSSNALEGIIPWSFGNLFIYNY